MADAIYGQKEGVATKSGLDDQLSNLLTHDVIFLDSLFEGEDSPPLMFIVIDFDEGFDGKRRPAEFAKLNLLLLELEIGRLPLIVEVVGDFEVYSVG